MANSLISPAVAPTGQLEIGADDIVAPGEVPALLSLTWDDARSRACAEEAV